MLPKDITIGVISTPGDPQLGTVLNGIFEVVQEHDGRVVTIGTPITDIGMPLPAMDSVDGWIVVHWPEGLDQLAATSVPLVAVNVDASGLNCPAVMPDNRGGVYTLISHLIDLGHQRIAFMGNLVHKDVRERYEGYANALADHHIPLDTTLVVDLGPGDENISSREAFRQLADGGLCCTAIFPCHDYNAQRIIAEARHRGYRVPEDLAVVGFDDIDTAQFFSPPITTVRQQFVEHGRVAARLLMRILSGDTVAAETMYVPTAMIIRRSCGATVAQLPDLPAIDIDAGWQETLKRALASLLQAPLSLDARTDPEHVWPGIGALVQAIEDVGSGGDLPPTDALDSVWRFAVVTHHTLANPLAAIDLVAQVGRQLVAATGDSETIQRMNAFIRQFRSRLIWHYQTQLSAGFGSDTMHVAEVYQWAVTRILYPTVGHAEQLAWVEQTNDIWGCFARWDGDPAQSETTLTVVGTYARYEQSRPALGTRYARTAFPPLDALPNPGGRTDLIVKLLPVRSGSNYWGVLALYGAIEPHIYSPPLAQVLANVLDREALIHLLSRQQETLQIAYERERMLAETVRELGSPIIPLLNGVLLVPLVGAIDSARAQQIIERVLTAVSEHQAETVLLDLTGVPLVDTQIASALIQTAQAATMLGARVYLVGVRPEIAQSIIGLGIDLGMLRTFSTLAAAIQSLRQVRSESQSRANSARP